MKCWIFIVHLWNTNKLLGLEQCSFISFTSIIHLFVSFLGSRKNESHTFILHKHIQKLGNLKIFGRCAIKYTKAYALFLHSNAPGSCLFMWRHYVDESDCNIKSKGVKECENTDNCGRKMNKYISFHIKKLFKLKREIMQIHHNTNND